ncbi:helix-turn-helix domain-containing protein [Saccharibacillus sp. O23]|uniref:helix-turn-helix domain-containing protein n=1 Tax=Saccharibacillus sp. O23 TaxID=2009338 RepID=UPI0015C64B51|nr:helix-turn-helix domain-containing protein [Saccharibacillus sp. O23]
MTTYWTIEDLAKKLQVTTRTIRNYLKSGELSGTKVGGQWRFTQDDIRHLTGFADPLTVFSEHSTDPDEFQEAMLAFNIPLSAEEGEPEKLRDRLLEQYNEVYSGPKRTFHYEVLTSGHVRVVLGGPHQYVLNFGSWIERNVYKASEKKNRSESEE